MKINNIHARQILDSRGNPTVEVDVWTDKGVFGRAAVPSGASTGAHEAHELRDGGEAYGGLGVQKALQNIREKILPAIKGMNVDDQTAIDNHMIELDGTENKTQLGANAMLAVSLACAHAAAKEKNILLYVHINNLAGNPEKSLPMPMMNVLNGGRHASQSSDFQEFMIVPVAAKTMFDTVRIGSEIFQSLKKELSKNHLSTAVGDEGGFSVPVSHNNEMLELLMDATLNAGYKPGTDVFFALDVAASEFYKNNGYYLEREKRQLTTDEMISYLQSIIEEYPVISIEDGLDQDDWGGWKNLTKTIPNVQLVGDDLLVTNTKRFEKALLFDAGNAILIKPNQIGTLTETIQTIMMAKECGWNTIISHRSGETEDTTIAHIAIGTGAGQIKTGSLSRGERTAKYNELLRLEEADSSLKLSNSFLT